MALVSVAEYKTYKNITVNTYDSQIAVLLAAMEDAVQRFCNRKFAQASYTERHTGIIDKRGFFHFWVENTPINSVTSLDVIYYATHQSIPIAVGDLDIFPKEGRMAYCMVLSKNFLLRAEYQEEFYYDVTYNGGWAAADIPASLKFAIMLATSDNFNYFFGDPANGNGDKDVKSLHLGDYSISYNSTAEKISKFADKTTGLILSQTVRNLLQTYVRIGQSTP